MIRIEIVLIEVQRLPVPPPAPEGQFADAANLVCTENSVIKDVYLVIGIVSLPEISDPCKFCCQDLPPEQLAERLRLPLPIISST